MVTTRYYDRLIAVIANDRFFLAPATAPITFARAGGQGGTGGLGGVGGAGGWQDGIVNGCHKTLNMLRYLAGIEATCNPQAVGVAQEIRLRARKILRNPVAHEFDEGRPW